MNGGNEDDGSFLETWMLADHFCQFEAIYVRHAHIHQNNSYVGLEQKLQRLLSRSGLDQILIEFSQYDIIAEQLGGLIIHHENIDFVVAAHFSFLTLPGLQNHSDATPLDSQMLPMEPHPQSRKQLVSVHWFCQVL